METEVSNKSSVFKTHVGKSEMSQWWPFHLKGGWAGRPFPIRGGFMPLRHRGALHKGQVAFHHHIVLGVKPFAISRWICCSSIVLAFSLEQFALSFGCCGMRDFAFVRVQWGNGTNGL